MRLGELSPAIQWLSVPEFMLHLQAIARGKYALGKSAQLYSAGIKCKGKVCKGKVWLLILHVFHMLQNFNVIHRITNSKAGGTYEGLMFKHLAENTHLQT